MAVYRIKQNFTAGEVSPLMSDRSDFERHKNGCKILKNMVVRTQGPTSRRSGFRFIYSINDLGLDTTDPQIRLVPFIFNEKQAYTMVFYKHASGVIRVVFATGNGLVVEPAVPTDPCPPAATLAAAAHTSEHVTIGTTAGGPTTRAAGDIKYIDMPANFGRQPDGTLDLREFDWAQSGDYFYMAQTGMQPLALIRHEHDCWELALLTFTAQPVDWSDTNGWPETVTFFQQRIAFGGNRLRRQTIWLSKAGDFHDFTEGTNGDDALTFTLDSGTQNKIMWMQAVKSLHVGTLGNEWTVSGGTLNAVTPTNVLSLRQTNNGSERIKPLMVGLTTLFVERFARVVNEFVYDYTYESYKTSDITILAPHLTTHDSIIDWTYQQTPDNIVWCIRDDGDMMALTYQRQHKVVGWHHHDTEGEFIAITSIPGDDRENDVWVAVKRVINGQDKWFLEKKAYQYKPLLDDASEAQFLDSFVFYDGVPISRITSGLGHLEGHTVELLIDGAVHPPVKVKNGGVEMNFSGSKICVGLPYTSEVRPHLPDVQLNSGTSEFRTQKISRLYIDLYQSLGMEVGRFDPEDGERIEEQPFRKPPNLMGRGVPLFSGVYKMTFQEGHDYQAEYFIRQRQPLPMTVLAVTDHIEVLD